MSERNQHPDTTGRGREPLPHDEINPPFEPFDAEAKLSAAIDALSASLREIEPGAEAERRLFARAEALGLLTRAPGQTPDAPTTWWQRFQDSFRPRVAFAGVAAALVAVVALWAVTREGEIPFLVGADLEVPRLSIPELAHAGSPPASAFERSQSAYASRRVPNRSTSNQEPATRTVANPVLAPRNPATVELASTSRPTAEEGAPGTSAAENISPASSSRYSEFMPVGMAPPLRTDEFVQAVRVRIGAEDLWRLGMPVNPSLPDARITADFLVGEDGRARAVRLVSTSH